MFCFCKSEQFNLCKSRNQEIFAADKKKNKVPPSSSCGKDRDSHSLHLPPAPLKSKDMLANCSCFLYQSLCTLRACLEVGGFTSAAIALFMNFSSALMLPGYKGPSHARRDMSRSLVQRNLGCNPRPFPLFTSHPPTPQLLSGLCLCKDTTRRGQCASASFQVGSGCWITFSPQGERKHAARA